MKKVTVNNTDLKVAPIASATNERQLQALLAAPDLKLDAEDLKSLDEAGDRAASPNAPM